MKLAKHGSLHMAIATALASIGIYAQQPTDPIAAIEPGLYATVDHSEIYIIQGDNQIDLKVGEAAFAGQDTLQKLDAVPSFLNWPCGDSSSQAQDMVPTYSFESLPPGKRIEEVVRRYFEGPEIPDAKPVWLNGAFHGSFPAAEISWFSSRAYWYEKGQTTARMAALRPKILLISLFPATQQVVVDGNRFEELREHFGPNDIPVTFVFNEENVVPVSYFGKNVTLQQVADAYFEQGISIAEVPMWYGGDRQLTVSPGALEQVFDIPAIEDIEPDRMAALVAALRANGFSRKPINVALMSQNNSMVIDEGEKVRAAQSIGIDLIPIVVFNYEEDSHKKRCGLAMPQDAIDGGIGEGGVANAVAIAGAGVTPAESLIAREKLASGN